MSSVEIEEKPRHATSTADTDFLLATLKQIISIRVLEQTAQDFSQTTPPRYMGSAHFCSGQEAVPVGTIAGLESSDQIVATYRGHGWALASGLSLVEVLGEICQRSVGVNGGRGGSAYMMAPWGRFIGENSIVGAGLPVACGVAQANLLLENGRVVVVSLGDGAFNQGATHEGLAFAAARKLPVLVVCENNGWSEMTPTSETVKVARLAQRASGYGMPGVTINGTDPLVVRDTIRQAAARARKGEGPVLIECRVPRLWGHYNRDIEHYRSADDRQAAKGQDPITLTFQRLLASGVVKDGDLQAFFDEAQASLEAASDVVLHSPAPDPQIAQSHVWASTEESPATNSDTPDIAAKTISYIQAVNEAIAAELETRPEVLVYGEDVGMSGGIFGASRGLQKRYGPKRVFDTPISESAILGSAVGSALLGLKPIVEIMWADFLLVALDQLINQAANVRYITGGRCGVPLVVRTQQGSTPGACAQHSQCLEALLAHIPGLRVALPATPQDAYDILRSAVANPDPCVIFEARGLYQTTGPVVLSDRIQPIGKAKMRREGSDAVVVTWGTMVRVALEATELLEQDGLHVGVLDLRWLSPLDETALIQAVRSAEGRVVIAHEANLTGGFGAEVATRIHELLGTELPLQIKRVATSNVRIPAAPALSQEVIPNAAKLVAAVHELRAAVPLDT